jgi:hypothetical protein
MRGRPKNSKNLTQKQVRNIVNKGDKFGYLTVISDPYYPDPNSNHKRQHVDCQCDCGKIRQKINSAYLKRGSVIHYCGYDCPLYSKEIVLDEEVPTNKKKLKIGFKTGKLTVIRDAFYHRAKGETNRNKCVECVCECGNHKIYREDKILRGAYKSCGCTWEKKLQNIGENKVCRTCKELKDLSDFAFNRTECSECGRWKQIQKNYNLSREQYFQLLSKQQGKCAICNKIPSQSEKGGRLFVDHCHQTGQIRGLLCFKCNSGLGNFSDDMEIMKNAINYLAINHS